MRFLNIQARFPLGVYLGHQQNGRPDWFPDPARLHAALVNSAGRGSTAEVFPEGMKPTRESVEALRWLEHNPPDGIEFPQQRWVAPNGQRFIYRRVSSINPKRPTEERAVSDGVSLSGSYGYFWKHVPEQIADTLELLCEDVAYLGEASSLAILECAEVNPTFHLDRESSPFDRAGRTVRVPAPGRTDHLIEQFASANPVKPPTVSRDKFKISELPTPAQAANDNLTVARYKDSFKEYPYRPWSQIIVLEILGDDIPEKHRVELCVDMHRALIKSIGAGAPGLVTGKYAPGVRRPANRLAIQYLPSTVATDMVDPQLGLNSGILLLMIPAGADESELDALATALPGVTTLWSRNIGRRNIRFSGNVVSAAEFWKLESDGYTRFWEPASPIIPETRQVSETKFGRTWTFADSGLLSLGFVWRDELDHSARGQDLYISVRNQVEERGARVLGSRIVPGKSASFAHKTHQSVVTQPWVGQFDLGDLSDSTSVIAIGQSRHLGGGLLIPLDIPTEEVPELWKEDRRV